MGNSLPICWSTITLEESLIHIIGGDWGKDVSDTIGDGYVIVKVIRGTDYKKWHIHRAKNASLRLVKEDSLAKRQLRIGDIVLEVSGGGPDQPVGRTIIIDETALSEQMPLLCSNFFRQMRVSKYLNPFYINYFLNFAYSNGAFNDFQTQTTNLRNLNVNDFISKTIIPVAPLAEQQRIVARLDALFEKVERNKKRLERFQELLKRLRQNILTAAITGKLTEDWRKKHSHFDKADAILLKLRAEKLKQYRKSRITETKDQEDLPELPEGWEWGRWDDYLDHSDNPFRRGPFGSTLKKEIFVTSGYKVYEQYCPINDDCSFVRYYISPKKFEELKSFSVKSGDFLISCSGVTLGRITQVPDHYEEGVINQALLRVRIDRSSFDDKFFLMLFRSPFFQRNIFKNSTGSAIPNVKGVQDLKSLPLPIMSFDEQKEIVLRVEKLFSLINHIEAMLSKIWCLTDRIPSTILSFAFMGKLVEQNPYYESASVLIERIRAEAVKSGTSKRKQIKK